jgi:hypothetical protein
MHNGSGALAGEVVACLFEALQKVVRLPPVYFLCHDVTPYSQ